MTIYEIAKPNKLVNSEIFFQQYGCSLFMEDGKWFVSGAKNQAEAERFIEAHNPPAPKNPTIQEKLASVGLNLDDLKVALGL